MIAFPISRLRCGGYEGINNPSGFISRVNGKNTQEKVETKAFFNKWDITKYLQENKISLNGVDILADKAQKSYKEVQKLSQPTELFFCLNSVLVYQIDRIRFSTEI